MINFREGFSSSKTVGNKVGTIDFTGAYKIDSSKVALFTKGIVLLNLSKNKKITLKITADFKVLKIPPRILFNNHKEVISASLVNTLPIKIIISTTNKNVAIKATILLV